MYLNPENGSILARGWRTYGDHMFARNGGRGRAIIYTSSYNDWNDPVWGVIFFGKNNRSIDKTDQSTFIDVVADYADHILDHKSTGAA